MIKWHSCDDKSITPPFNVDLLLAHQAQHFPEVDVARWSGTVWLDTHDSDYFYRDSEVEFWALMPEYPHNLEKT